MTLTPRAERNQRTVTSRNRDAEVVAAAIEVMSAKGYSATSIQEVAEKVGVLKGSLYHYFDSKEALLARILTESHATTIAIHENLQAKELPPFEELKEYIRLQTIWYVENPERANIYFTERRHLTGELLQNALARGRDFERYIQDLVIAAQGQGEIRQNEDYRLITRFVAGALNGVRHWPSRSGKQFSTEVIAEAAVTFVTDAIKA